MSQLIPITTPLREFKGHDKSVWAVAVFPDKRRMVTGSKDKTLRLWDLDAGVMLKKMQGHSSRVWALAVSWDGQLIASGDENGKVIIWHGQTGESLTLTKAHSYGVYSLDFSPNGTVLATGSHDKTTKLWNTTTWQPELQGVPIKWGGYVYCVRYSPSGELLAIATTTNIQIYNPSTRERAFSISAHSDSLAWTPDGTRLLTGGDKSDPTIREWDTTTWEQVGDSWAGHSDSIHSITVNPAGTLVASASHDNYVRLWQISERRTIAIFKHSHATLCITFSLDGKHILSGGKDMMISEWEIPNNINSEIIDSIARIDGDLPTAARPLRQDINTDADSDHTSYTDRSKIPDITPAHIPCIDRDMSTAQGPLTQDVNTDADSVHSSYAHRSKILAITTAHDACIAGDLSTAEELLTQEIDADANNYTSYAHRSFVMARQHNWVCALQDAIKSISIEPSLIGYISKGIALYGKGHIRDARVAFDVAFMYTNQDSQTVHFLLLIKAIALFNANQDDEASLLLKELAAGCPNADTHACYIVEAYLRVQLGIKALEGARHAEAADHFTAALTSSAFVSRSPIHFMYEDLVVLFGWDLKSLWQKTHQKRCDALLRVGKLQDAVESYRYMMDTSDDIAKADCLEWLNAFKQDCIVLFLTNGDAALAACNYDRAIDLYSAAIDLDYTSDVIFANRSKAKLEKGLWMEALLDAQKVIQLNPSSHVGYKLEHAAFHGAQLYDEAIAAFQTMLLKLDKAPDTEIRNLLQQYLSPSEVGRAIRKVINAQLDNAPLRVLDTTTGLLCDRETQIRIFQTTPEYMELVSTIIVHPDLRINIEDVVKTYFRYVMLSHRWEGKEPHLQDIQGKVVYKLDPVGGTKKLQSFCKTARDLGYRWAWSDTCCIDKSNNVERQESVNSMFAWYHHSALTVVYLSDVPPSSKAGALAKSAWNTRGWTVQEFLVPNAVLFYQRDWTLYLADHTPNHKDSAAIMQELEDATGIDRQAVVNFRPGMRGAREKLQWASTRNTTIKEDIAYSLFGIFGVHLPVIYGEKQQNALGRLLQEIVAQSGDITALDWVGESSEFNSCLPADITSYAAPPYALPSLSEDNIQMAVSLLRTNPVAVDLASRLYEQLDHMKAARFAHHRLHLPCIVFPVTEVRLRPGRDQDTYVYAVKSDALHDLQIITEDRFTPFSPARPPPAWQKILLVRPWSRDLLELHDPVDDAQSVENWSVHESLSHDSLPAQTEPVYSDSHSRALRLLVRLGQPFGAFLLARQRNGEFKRIASGQDIIAQVKDMTSVGDMMDIQILEVL